MTGRFAPTPSGRMHIGNVYAMLGACLLYTSANAQSRRKRDGGSDRSGNRSAQNLADFHDLDGDGRLQIGSINGTLHRYISRLLHLIGSQLIPMDGLPTLRAILVTDPNRTVQLLSLIHISLPPEATVFHCAYSSRSAFTAALKSYGWVRCV